MVIEFSFMYYSDDPFIRIPGQAMARIIHLIERLEAEYQYDSPNTFRRFTSYPLTLFFKLNRFVNGETNATDAAVRLTQSYENALMQPIYDIRTVTPYAAHLAVSQTYLNRCLQLGRNGPSPTRRDGVAGGQNLAQPNPYGYP